MGYCMVQLASQFLIKKENKEKALEAIKSLIGHETCDGNHFSYVNYFKNSKTFENAMRKWRWETIENENEDIIDIHFLGENLGDDLLLFSKIAPFVEDGSFIQMSGEGSSVWRWIFSDWECKEWTAKYS